MKGVTTFLITVQKHEVAKIREEIRRLGIVFVEEDWTPRRTSHPVRKTKRIVQKLHNKLLDAFFTNPYNRAYLEEETH